MRASPWPDVAWKSSALTDDGFPVEFAWSSRDPAIRWTAEAAGPEIPEAARVAAAATLLRSLGWAGDAPRPGGDGAPLRFGAWIGGRHGPDGDRFKLYVERPLDPAPPRDLERALSRRIEWRMQGHGGGLIEHYGRLRRLEFADMRRALDWAGIGATEAIARLVGELRPGKPRDHPLGPLAGISVALRAGAPVALSWFAPARAISSSQREITAAARRGAAACGGSTERLDALLGDGPNPLGRIGMIGLGAAEGGRCWIQASWRPEQHAQPT